MGYYTIFEIKVQGKSDIETITEELRQVSDYAFEARKDTISNYDEIKWYKWEMDMKKISKKFSNNLFQVDGVGEEAEDIWRCFFHNGIKEEVSVKRVYGESNLKRNFEANEVIDKILSNSD